MNHIRVTYLTVQSILVICLHFILTIYLFLTNYYITLFTGHVCLSTLPWYPTVSWLHNRVRPAIKTCNHVIQAPRRVLDPMPGCM